MLVRIPKLSISSMVLLYVIFYKNQWEYVGYKPTNITLWSFQCKDGMKSNMTFGRRADNRIYTILP